jgi:hypothetical protein
MKKTLPILLLLFSTCSYSSIINGSVFLDNTADHSGIIIKFNPVSPSAVYAESTSGTNGSYNITIVNGIYNISFEKNGYQTYTLNNQFISTNSTLANVTLNSNAVVTVSGNVSGNWTNTNTYIVNGDITIPLGETLTIEPGTKIKFNGYYSLIVNGTLNAVGSESNYIRFTSNSTSPTNIDWNQILINTYSTASQLKYCIVEYGKKDNDDNIGIVHVLGELNIENCIIQYSQETGISARGNTKTINILNNTISNCSYGITVVLGKSANIIGNKIFNINLIGMHIGLDSNSTIVQNNQISNCGFYGIQSWSDIVINNNILYNIGSNISNYAIIIVGGKPLIKNNTIFSNAGGIGIYSSDYFSPNPIINSNIITNNTNYGIRSEGTPKPALVTYNLFYNNGLGTGNNLPIGVGTVVTTNNNGINADTYYNIFSSPNLASTNSLDSNFCVLNSNSDAINAGDPAITNNFNATIIDIGAKESSVLSINKFSNNDFAVFPNPVVNQVIIQAKNGRLFNKLILNDINGQIVKEYKLETPVNEYTVENLNDLKSGVYILTIYSKFEKTQQIKLLKK